MTKNRGFSFFAILRSLSQTGGIRTHAEPSVQQAPRVSLATKIIVRFPVLGIAFPHGLWYWFSRSKEGEISMPLDQRFVPFNPNATRNRSIVNISKNTLRFNVKTASLLGYPPYAVLLLNREKRQLALKASETPLNGAVPFCVPGSTKDRSLRICSRGAAKLLRQTAEWNSTGGMNILGEYSPKDQAIIYNLEAAQKPSARGGWKDGRRKRKAITEQGG